MKILQLKSENVKRLNAVEISPDGSMVIIAGENANGKTSVLDSIEMALSGGNSICAQPIHSGAKKGSTQIDLGEFIVTRNYTQGGTSLTVTTKDGAKLSSPQKVLDDLVGKLTFDPLAFQRMKAPQQLEALREMAGIDFTMLDAKRDRIYSERTDANRELKRLQGALASLPRHNDAPAEAVSIEELSQELTDSQANNAFNDNLRRSTQPYEEKLKSVKSNYSECSEEIKRLEARLVELRKTLEQITEDGKQARAALDEATAKIAQLEDIDTAPIIERINNADAINQKVRANRQHAETAALVKAKESEADALTKQLEAIEEKKLARIQSAQFPVEGLSLNDAGVTFNGIAFEQASGAEQLRVSVAIAMAANPRLKIMLCRDGSLLDKKSLALLSEIVTDNGYQCWLERVGTDDPCAIVIEDGYVKEVQ